nr:MAG TPA: hypothetical protein [Caudoviricetes sp.]
MTKNLKSYQTKRLQTNTRSLRTLLQCSEAKHNQRL